MAIDPNPACPVGFVQRDLQIKRRHQCAPGSPGAHRGKGRAAEATPRRKAGDGLRPDGEKGTDVIPQKMGQMLNIYLSIYLFIYLYIYIYCVYI